MPIGTPAGAYQDREYGTIVCGRGPVCVDALAERLGPEGFDEFLRDYYESQKWGIATGDAFKEIAEQHCQCDLTSMFEEWVYAR